MRWLAVAVVVVSTVARASDQDDIAKLVRTDVDTFYGEREKKPAVFAEPSYEYGNGTGGASERMNAIGMWSFLDHDMRQRQITLSRDGKSAWASYVEHVQLGHPMAPGVFVNVDFRASEVLAKTKDGWRIVAITWTEPYSDASIEKLAQSEDPPALDDPSNEGDASLRDAFVALVTTGFAKVDDARKDLVVFGSAAGERTTSGPAFARAWNAVWAKHAKITGSVEARLAPSGTTGWVVANVSLPRTKGKKSFAVPFRVFAVFDKTASGTWQLAHAHLSVPGTPSR